MEFNDFLSLLKKKRQTILTIVLVFLMLTLVLSLAQTMKYTVKSRLLVIQNAGTSDAYVLSKSNEYLGTLFAEIVYSSSFYDQVLSSNYNISQSYFTGSYSQQIKKWQSTVKTKTQGNTGIIEIYVYHPQVSEAKKIALAVNDILMNKNQAYQGGEGVRINIIDQPIASTFPNKPNLFNNLAIAFFGSLLVSLFYIYIFPEDKYSFSIASGKRKRRAIRKLEKDILENYGQNTYRAHQASGLEVEAARQSDHQKKIEEEPAKNTEWQNNDKPEDYHTLNGDINNIIKHW